MIPRGKSEWLGVKILDQRVKSIKLNKFSLSNKCKNKKEERK